MSWRKKRILFTNWKVLEVFEFKILTDEMHVTNE